jgi:hypothetical protein
MPAYSFMAKFVPYVESGVKTHTIRGKRKHPPRVGQTAYLYTGMRTKGCRFLLKSPITQVDEIRIKEEGVVFVNGKLLGPVQLRRLARSDGFLTVQDFVAFWEGRVPFEGHIIHWQHPREL